MAVTTPDYSPDELTELLSGLMPDIPGYRVMRLIGRGGMSYVYLGVQESLERQVAIKVIRPDALKDEVSKLRFEKEARTIAKLQHPCIVGIHEVGRTEHGLLFYVMPYLARGHVGERDLTGNEQRIVEVLRALLWALEYAHARGVVHRDVKAENVLFDNADRPVLADFGIAISRQDRARITGSGFAIGSSPHMAPEQARGEGVDGRADLYSLGVLAFEMLSGRLPYRNDDPLGLALMHAVDPIPRLPDDKQHWQPFVDSAMAKSPPDRFADARAMMAALDDVDAALQRGRLARPTLAGRLDGGSRLQWATWRARAGRVRAARRAPVIAAAATLLLAAFGWLAVELRSVPADSVRAVAEVPVGAPMAPALSTSDPGPARQAGAAGPDPIEPDVGDGIPLEQMQAQPMPAPPGARELAAAAQQISRRRLTQPAGDNAFESLRAAQRLVPDSPALGELGDRWLTAATPYVERALAAGDEAGARALHDSAVALAGQLQLRHGEAWARMEAAIAAPLRSRLQDALLAGNLDAVRAVKVEIGRWGLAASLFEPHWSQPLVIARPGSRLEGDSALVLARLPDQDGPGLAVMPTAVTRAAYATFVSQTGRADSACRVRTALMTLRKRSWENPGFAQQAGHPAVCVSIADALAYASWLGERDGVRYRLPTVAEWQALAGHAAGVDSCRRESGRCGIDGTVVADAGAMSAPGLHAMHGNIREWQSDCAPGCRRQPAFGLGWRDVATGDSSRVDDRVDPQFGYDDIGFRLVRDVLRQELEVL